MSAQLVSENTSVALPAAETITAFQSALRQAGDKSRAEFVVHTRLVDRYQTQAVIRNFELTIDEPASLGGTDRGPNPVEVVLAALGACQEIVYATYAALLGVRIQRLEIRVTGQLDPRGFFNVADVPAGFERVEYEVDLQTDAPPDKTSQLIELVNRHCPVLDILQRPIPTQGHVRVNQV
ncbi:MAG: OsmC family protein [Anaerolineae bacterium]|nr:OsmC family protein [Thermoflexales bacterium]MDW8407292.1 OsmC family protein [Anaerolineae bacterium]